MYNKNNFVSQSHETSMLEVKNLNFIFQHDSGTSKKSFLKRSLKYNRYNNL